MSNKGNNGRNGSNGNQAVDSEPVLRIRDLRKTYMQGKIPVHALDGVSFDVKKGELLSIVGPSGSGKSTLLSMIGLLDRPTEGRVFIDDVEITKAKESEAPRIRREKIGVVFQHFILLADEPTGAVDTKTREVIVELLKGLSEKGQTIIVVTHDMDVASQTDRIITMRDGMIASDTGVKGNEGQG